MDYGLVALMLLLVIMIGACVVMFLRVKTGIDSNRDVSTRLDLVVKVADEARAIAQSIEVAHYKGLVKRVDQLDEALAEAVKVAGKVEDRLISLSAKVGGLKRWSKAEEMPEAPPEVSQETITFAPPSADNSRPRKGFGQKA